MLNERAVETESMVSDLEAAGISDGRVLAAMARLPRHLFLPEEQRPFAYEDRALPIGYGQTISQPYMEAKLLESLELDGTERVLDVGTGSGYQAALLGILAREVYSVEIVPDLARSARELLRLLGCYNVHVVLGDGTLGLSRFAPYDAIACAAAAEAIPAPLVENLADGGRLVLPIGNSQRQELVLVTKHGTSIETRRICSCIFVPLVGAGEPYAALGT